MELRTEGRGEDERVRHCQQDRVGEARTTLWFPLNRQVPEEGDEGLRAPRSPGIIRVGQQGANLLAYKLPTVCRSAPDLGSETL